MWLALWLKFLHVFFFFLQAKTVPSLSSFSSFFFFFLFLFPRITIPDSYTAGFQAYTIQQLLVWILFRHLSKYHLALIICYFLLTCLKSSLLTLNFVTDIQAQRSTIFCSLQSRWIQKTTLFFFSVLTLFFLYDSCTSWSFVISIRPLTRFNFQWIWKGLYYCCLYSRNFSIFLFILTFSSNLVMF